MTRNRGNSLQTLVGAQYCHSNDLSTEEPASGTAGQPATTIQTKPFDLEENREVTRGDLALGSPVSIQCPVEELLNKSGRTLQMCNRSRELLAYD